MGERLRGNEYRTTTICVDEYDNGVPVGRFYNPACSEGIPFQSLSQLLVKLQELLDGMSFPQSFTLNRATFGVRILFRQNASWQGSVSWLEGEREESFRSVLELILLMDSAMGQG